MAVWEGSSALTGQGSAKAGALGSPMQAMGFDLDRYMKRVVRDAVPDVLLGMVEYHLGWRDDTLREAPGILGKRGRPMLALLVYQLFRPDYTPLLPVAAALEFTHNFSLVFDDIQDRDATRRGRPAVWALWGDDEAINVGCAINALVWVSLNEVRSMFSDQVAQAIQRYLPQIMLRLGRGQELDLLITKARNQSLGTDQYLSMIADKTASLFEAAGYLGSQCAGALPREQELSRLLGHYIGVSFQILDDVIGIWARREAGQDKPSRDLDKRKKTYPVIVAFQEASPADRLILAEYFQGAVNVDEDEVRALLDRTGSREKSLMLGKTYLAEALNYLERLKGDPGANLRIAEWIQFVADKQLSAL